MAPQRNTSTRKVSVDESATTCVREISKLVLSGRSSSSKITSALSGGCLEDEFAAAIPMVPGLPICGAPLNCPMIIRYDAHVVESVRSNATAMSHSFSRCDCFVEWGTWVD